MSNPLIVALTALFLLSSCCTDANSPDCTVSEKQQIENNSKPKLLAEQDGVRLYCWKCNYSYPVYFTTPCGDVHWNEHHGKATTTNNEVNGTGCK